MPHVPRRGRCARRNVQDLSRMQWPWCRVARSGWLCSHEDMSGLSRSRARPVTTMPDL